MNSSIIFPSFEYVAVSYDHTLYVSADTKYLQNCKKLIDVFICPSTTTVEATLGPCEVQVIAMKRNPKCKPQQHKLQNIVSTELKPNNWIIAAPAPTTTSICCSGRCFQELIDNNVKLTLNFPCFATIEGKKLQATHDGHQVISHVVDLPLITLEMHNNTNYNRESLDIINVDTDFNKIHNLIREQRDKLNSMHNQTVSTFNYSLAFGLLLIIIVLTLLKNRIKKLYNTLREKCQTNTTNPSDQPRPVPRSRPINLRTMFD